MTPSASPPAQSQRVRVIVLTCCLFVVATLAALFSITVVQIQSVATAYAGGESAWSRGQVSAIYYLDRYAETGNPEELDKARDWLAIPLGDRRARLAMEQSPIDYEQAREGFLQGQNHADDIPAMIWLFRYFADAPYFQDAVEVWRETDDYLDELVRIARELESAHSGQSPDDDRLDALRARLNTMNDELGVLAPQFREALSESGRWLNQLLSLVSVIFLFVLGLLAAMLIWRLSRAVSAQPSSENPSGRGLAAIAEINAEGDFLDINDSFAKRLGYDASTLTRYRLRDLITRDTQQREIWHRELLSGERDRYTADVWMRCGDRTSRPVTLAVSRGPHPLYQRERRYLLSLR